MIEQETTEAGAAWLAWARDALALIHEHLVSDDECRCTSDQRCTHCRGLAIVRRAERLGIGPVVDSGQVET